MALRAPLVLVNGQLEQLQPGDSLAAAISGYEFESLLNGDTVPLIAGMVAYLSAAGTVKRANASALATSGGVVGLIIDPTIAIGANGNVATDGPITLTTEQWDAVITGDSASLSFGSIYYIDPTTPGNITTTPPATQGQVVVALGIAISATTLKLSVEASILL
jgi:hypothetical protein